jgi:hypothetical protein
MGRECGRLSSTADKAVSPISKAGNEACESVSDIEGFPLCEG